MTRAHPEPVSPGESSSSSPGRLFAVALLFVALVGCVGRDGRKILTSANAYDATDRAYAARCVEAVGAACQPCYEALVRWKRSLDEASVAYKRGGQLPAQLEALKAAEAEARSACSK